MVGAQPMTLVLPDAVSGLVILDLRVTVATASSGTSTVNVERCVVSGNPCSATENTWAPIYSTALTLPASNYKSSKGAAPDQNASNLAAGDRFRVNLLSVGASLSDVTVTLTYKANTTT